MSEYKPMGAVLIGYVRDYRYAHGSSLREAKAAVEAGWRPGQEPPPADPRDAEIVSLRSEIATLRADLARVTAERDEWAANNILVRTAANEDVARAEAEVERVRGLLEAESAECRRVIEERIAASESLARVTEERDAARDNRRKLEVERLTRLLDVTRENARLLASSSGERERGRNEGVEEAATLCDGSADSNVDVIGGHRYLRQFGERGIGNRIRALRSSDTTTEGEVVTDAEREVIEAAKGIARFVPTSSWVTPSPARRATTRLNKALAALRAERKRHTRDAAKEK